MEFPTFSFHTYRNTFSARLNATMIAFSLKFLLSAGCLPDVPFYKTSGSFCDIMDRTPTWRELNDLLDNHFYKRTDSRQAAVACTA